MIINNTIKITQLISYFKKNYNLSIKILEKKNKDNSYNIFFNKTLNISKQTKILDLKKNFQGLGLKTDIYISEIGTVPNNIKLSNLKKFERDWKKKQTINVKLDTVLALFENSNYSEKDWSLRYLSKLLPFIKFEDFDKLKKILKIIKNKNFSFYKKILNAIENYKENNKNLNLLKL